MQDWRQNSGLVRENSGPVRKDSGLVRKNSGLVRNYFQSDAGPVSMSPPCEYLGPGDPEIEGFGSMWGQLFIFL